MIAMLKLLSQIAGRYPFDHWTKEFPFSGYDHFWKAICDGIKKLAMSPQLTPDALRKNQKLADYLLE